MMASRSWTYRALGSGHLVSSRPCVDRPASFAPPCPRVTKSPLRMVVAGGSPWRRPAYPGEGANLHAHCSCEVEKLMKIMETVLLNIQTQEKVEFPKDHAASRERACTARRQQCRADVYFTGWRGAARRPRHGQRRWRSSTSPRILSSPRSNFKRRSRFRRSRRKSRTRMSSTFPAQRGRRRSRKSSTRLCSRRDPRKRSVGRLPRRWLR